ncbi:MAG TPA: c-type cytochrome, partial [Bryobacteraceae bacterium]|nr:c-type cytochrome [Bryobacteraceae bacterium]
MTKPITHKRTVAGKQPSAMPRTRIAILAFASCAALWGQNPPAGPPLADIKQTYAKLCSGCHGADARGTQQGPGLAGNVSVRRRSIQRLRSVIRNGIPAAGMPGFDLPDGTLDALAALVASLNASAAEANVPGDRAAGKEFFFGKGQCASCHMVHGEGAPIGPDLSNVGREMTFDEIRESLLRPDARITPAYGMVSARLLDGTTLRGFARSRTS